MILKIDGKLSRYYAESLVLLFFPGSKFPEDFTLDFDKITVTVAVEGQNDTAFGRVEIKGEDRYEIGEYTVPTHIAERKTEEMCFKLAAGGAMLIAGEKYTGCVPPWGMLTGVRPAKMAYELLNKGYTEEQAALTLREDFLCSPEKARLAALTAVNESLYITDIKRKECSVYISIPFCPSKCSYCSFVSFTSKRLLSLIPQYLSALISDIYELSTLIRDLSLRVSSIYIGGGTPTTLDFEQLEMLLSAISKAFDVASLDEFTLEAGRPDTIDFNKLSIAKAYGVSRISVNTQTLNDQILSAIGRNHTADDFFKAYELAVKSGIKDINVDLIAGLPNESYESFVYSVDKICELSPSNITVHTFYAKRASDVVRNSQEVYRIKDLETEKAVKYSQDKIISSGYLPYYMYRQKNTAANLENVGYAKKGRESIYNIMMMEEIHTVFGAGAGAMTKLVSPDSSNMKITRICDFKYPYEYLDNHNNEIGRNKKIHLREEAKKFYM